MDAEPVDGLEQLLALPDTPPERAHQWGYLIQGHTLYRALRAAVARKETDWVGCDLALRRDWWNTYFNSRYTLPADEHRAAWPTVKRLFACAKLAAANPDAFAHAIDKERLNATDLGEWLNDDKCTAWVWIRCFLAPPSAPTKVYAALADNTDSQGWVVELELTTVPAGSGRVCRHPADAFGMDALDGFSRALQDAWEAAVALAQDEGHEVAELGATWKLVGKDLPSEVDGPSLSGAAGRGWWHLLTGRLPDAGVIVLAQAKSNGDVVEVGGMAAKTAAIAAHAAATPLGPRRIDTIVAAGPANAQTARAALARLGSVDIRVIDLSTP